MPGLACGRNDILPSFYAMSHRPVPHRLGLLIFPGFQILDAAGPIASFEIAGRYGGGAYAIETLAIQGGAVRSSSGVAMAAVTADADGPFDTLMICGGDGTREASTDAPTLV